MNTQNQKKIYPRGSEWRKWDLHVHTPESVLYNQFTNWDQYIAKLKSIEDVAVLGITDYFSIEGYKKVLEYRKQGKVSNFDLILPNIEIRVLPVTASETPINLHLIFSNLLEICELEDFLKELKFDYRSNNYSCERHKLIDLGRVFNPNLSEHEAYKEGINQFKTDITQLKNIFNRNKKLKDNVIIAVSNRSEDGASGIQHSSLTATREEIYRFADIIFSSNYEDRAYFLGQGTDDKETIITKYGRLKPCVHGSDAHSLERICYPCAKFGMHNCISDSANCELRYTWIKADPTFEGLKQIIYEPIDRVRIQESNPEPLKSSHSIDSLKISNGNINRNLSIENVKIPLNRNLVAVIGGKGSGKTALLDLIANCYPDKIDSSNKNSFVNRIFNEGQDLLASINFLNQENFSKKLVESKFVTDSDIEYIPQGQIENKIGNTREFHNFLQNLIFKSDKVRNSAAYFEYCENEKNKKEIKQKIKKLNQDIFTIETQIKNENIENINRQLKLKETEKTDIQEKINSANKLLTKEKLEEVNKFQNELSVFKDTREKLSTLNHLTKSTLEKLTEIDNLNQNIEIIKNLTNELNLKHLTVGMIEYKSVKTQIENIQKKVTLELSTISGSIEQVQHKIEKLQKDKKEYIVLLNKIKEVDVAINSLKNKQKNIVEMNKSLSERIEKRWTLYEQLFNTYLLLRKTYKEIIDVFSKDAYEILAGIEFKSSLTFDSKNFAETGEDILDLRTVRESKMQKVSLLDSELLRDIINAIEKLIESKNNNPEIGKLTEIMKQKIDDLLKIKKSTRTNEHLYEWLFGDYLLLNTETYFNGIYLEKLSLGQKCTVLLKVYLAQGENTILIDQPDDNLDNEFIMNELVRAIRKAKLNRQVIIASNNANVVINSDAEQVIVAEYRNGKIAYIMGGIEEPIIKEKAIHILEGGRIAFEAREKKYDFK